MTRTVGSHIDADHIELVPMLLPLFGGATVGAPVMVACRGTGDHTMCSGQLPTLFRAKSQFPSNVVWMVGAILTAFMLLGSTFLWHWHLEERWVPK